MQSYDSANRPSSPAVEAVPVFGRGPSLSSQGFNRPAGESGLASSEQAVHRPVLCVGGWHSSTAIDVVPPPRPPPTFTARVASSEPAVTAGSEQSVQRTCRSGGRISDAGEGERRAPEGSELQRDESKLPSWEQTRVPWQRPGPPRNSFSTSPYSPPADAAASSSSQMTGTRVLQTLPHSASSCPSAPWTVAGTRPANLPAPGVANVPGSTPYHHPGVPNLQHLHPHHHLGAAQIQARRLVSHPIERHRMRDVTNRLEDRLAMMRAGAQPVRVGEGMGGPGKRGREACGGTDEPVEVEDWESGLGQVGGATTLYQDYQPGRLHHECLVAHTDPVTESSTLGFVLPPVLEYKVKLPSRTVLEGRLTSLQLESVMYACQQHQRFLPGGKVRAGFFMGDGPGLGKGRQIAGIILENYIRGRKRAVWISSGADLVNDAARDLRDIGAAKIKVHDMRDYRLEEKLSRAKDLKSGVLFVTYALLVKEKKQRSRLKQLLEWCGADFDGVVALDECHKAKNLSENSENVGGSKTARVVRDLQLCLPKARCVYASATGASAPQQLVYALRLGLWGDGTQFPTHKEFAREINSGGVGAMELLAVQMKSAGQFLARSLSFKGATFDVVELDAGHVEEVWERSCEVWAELCSIFESKVGAGSRMMLFWGAHQRFFSALLMAAKVRGTVQLAQAALAAGKCVVIGLQNTGEALGRELEEGGEDGGGQTIPSRCKAILLGLMASVDFVPDSVVQRVRSLALPPNPLDQLIHELGGHEKVAEMTARTKRCVCKGGKFVLVPRGRHGMDTCNVAERKKFQRGQKLIAIISDAASTGISLQADKRVKNQRRRVHLTLQLPWSADSTVQQMGRSHRSNQASAPEFKLLMTKIGGESRFASAVASRLQSLGALTHGDRRAASGASTIADFSFDPACATKALQDVSKFLQNPEQTDKDEWPEFIEREYEGDAERFCSEASAALSKTGLGAAEMVQNVQSLPVKKFQNRMLGLAVPMQNRVFQLFTTFYQQRVHEAKSEQKLSDGILDLEAKRVQIQKEERVYAGKGDETWLLHVTVDRGVTWEQAAALAEENKESSGFYESESIMGQKFISLAFRNQKGSKFFVVRPNTGHKEQSRSDFRKMTRHYTKVSVEKAQRLWTEKYEFHARTCGHKASSKHCAGPACTYQKTQLAHYVLTGSVLRFWSIIKTTMKNGTMRVLRFEADGKRVVGLRLENTHVAKVRAAIAREAAKAAAEAAGADRAAGEGGERPQLAGAEAVAAQRGADAHAPDAGAGAGAGGGRVGAGPGRARLGGGGEGEGEATQRSGEGGEGGAGPRRGDEFQRWYKRSHRQHKKRRHRVWDDEALEEADAEREGGGERRAKRAYRRRRTASEDGDSDVVAMEDSEEETSEAELTRKCKRKDKPQVNKSMLAASGLWESDSEAEDWFCSSDSEMESDAETDFSAGQTDAEPDERSRGGGGAGGDARRNTANRRETDDKAEMTESESDEEEGGESDEVVEAVAVAKKEEEEVVVEVMEMDAEVKSEVKVQGGGSMCMDGCEHGNRQRSGVSAVQCWSCSSEFHRCCVEIEEEEDAREWNCPSCAALLDTAWDDSAWEEEAGRSASPQDGQTDATAMQAERAAVADDAETFVDFSAIAFGAEAEQDTTRVPADEELLAAVPDPAPTSVDSTDTLGPDMDLCGPADSADVGRSSIDAAPSSHDVARVLAAGGGEAKPAEADSPPTLSAEAADGAGGGRRAFNMRIEERIEKEMERERERRSEAPADAVKHVVKQAEFAQGGADRAGSSQQGRPAEAHKLPTSIAEAERAGGVERSPEDGKSSTAAAAADAAGSVKEEPECIDLTQDD